MVDAGALTGDAKLKRQGKTDQAVGNIKQMVEDVIGGSDAARRAAFCRPSRATSPGRRRRPPPIFQALYDSMSEAQKKTADACFQNRGHRKFAPRIASHHGTLDHAYQGSALQDRQGHDDSQYLGQTRCNIAHANLGTKRR
jgi:hypothetical protein